VNLEYLTNGTQSGWGKMCAKCDSRCGVGIGFGCWGPDYPIHCTGCLDGWRFLPNGTSYNCTYVPPPPPEVIDHGSSTESIGESTIFWWYLGIACLTVSALICIYFKKKSDLKNGKIYP